ncbi:MAG TPA: SpoIID/LytB domain-containing protein [Solirubrobacteraceae bacterium]|nr:SpoIID/LytB domain-containing protein [Solirubrobacteraceae bacterium]
MPVIYPTYHRPSAALRGHARQTVALLAGVLAGLCLWAGAAAGASGSTLVIEGAGDGHGVGMSQDGAYGYAVHGATYQAILAHYYTGTTLGQAPANAVVRVLEGTKVVKVALERYVRGVVAAEMPASWPLAALEAQAIASRTYALTDHAGGSRFDVYADTRSQVYEGAAAETATSNAAVADTAGQIVVYGAPHPQPAITFFFASSGGMTEDIENAWPGSAPQPWLRAVADPYESSTSSWRVSMSFASATARLSGLVKGSLRGIEVLRRGASPRIVSAQVLGTGGDTQVSGPELEARLGLQSTWAHFSVKTGASVTPEPDLSGQPTAPSPPTSIPPTTPAPSPEGATPAQPATPALSSSAQGGAQAPGAPVSTLSTGGAAA